MACGVRATQARTNSRSADRSHLRQDETEKERDTNYGEDKTTSRTENDEHKYILQQQQQQRQEPRRVHDMAEQETHSLTRKNERRANVQRGRW